MLFKSRQVNLDPNPWVTPYGRVGAESVHGCQFDPRPEFEPTRDPYPWVMALGPWAGSRIDRQVPESEWSPRRDQFDTPVNPILERFRLRRSGFLPDDELSVAEHARNWLAPANWERVQASVSAATPEHIAHARKVLSRLAALA